MTNTFYIRRYWNESTGHGEDYPDYCPWTYPEYFKNTVLAQDPPEEWILIYPEYMPEILIEQVLGGL